jgi:hypothetical protein
MPPRLELVPTLEFTLGLIVRQQVGFPHVPRGILRVSAEHDCSWMPSESLRQSLEQTLISQSSIAGQEKLKA